MWNVLTARALTDIGIPAEGGFWGGIVGRAEGSEELVRRDAGGLLRAAVEARRQEVLLGLQGVTLKTPEEIAKRRFVSST